MGVSYDNLGRYSQAIGCYQSALKLDPKLDYVYNNIGYSYLLKNELDAAIVAFQKAIELNDQQQTLPQQPRPGIRNEGPV